MRHHSPLWAVLFLRGGTLNNIEEEKACRKQANNSELIYLFSLRSSLWIWFFMFLPRFPQNSGVKSIIWNCKPNKPFLIFVNFIITTGIQWEDNTQLIKEMVILQWHSRGNTPLFVNKVEKPIFWILKCRIQSHFPIFWREILYQILFFKFLSLCQFNLVAEIEHLSI